MVADLVAAAVVVSAGVCVAIAKHCNDPCAQACNVHVSSRVVQYLLDGAGLMEVRVHLQLESLDHFLHLQAHLVQGVLE